jgi:hypothetical protein
MDGVWCKAEPAARLEPVGLEAGALVTGKLLPPRSPQPLQWEPGEKPCMALGARGPRESLVEGDERKGNQSPHLCELLGRGANGIHKTVRSVSQEVIEFQSSIPLEAL